MATYSLNQQPYLIENIGYAYANTRTIGPGGDYERLSLFSSVNSNDPVFFGNAHDFTLNLFGTQ